MTQTIEISELDLRYESCRMKNPEFERRLLGSIQQRGIEEPLSGVDPGQQHILLDGFKRLRCARSLGLHSLPYAARGADPALGIVSLLRGSQPQPLTLLEQACFIDELHTLHGLSQAEIAQQLGRSKAWVSLRLGLFEELTPAVREKLLAGQFPAYAYLYTIRPFMRINRLPAARLEAFVLALSGKGLSVRESAWLFQGFVGGSPALQEQILQGRLDLLLRQHLRSAGAGAACSALEKSVLLDLERIVKHLRRVVALGAHEGLKSPAFQAQASLLTGGILKESGPFLQRVRDLHARSEQV
jgi:ParB-like chromosome segregation protein Spo0J